MKDNKKVILEVKNLHKNIGKKEILKDISFTVSEGEILGFIGPNGAGKTTAIKLILGLQSISSGSIYINGYSIKKEFTKAIERVGAIVENPDMYMYLTGLENLKLNTRMYKNISKDRIEEVIKIVGLENRINDKVSKYSLGMRQRLGIAIALLHKPNLLVLDEPNNGLDPEGIRDLRNLLKKLSIEENIAVLISSHNLSEIENLCSDISVISKGKIIETSTMEDFKFTDFKYNFEISEIKDFEKLKTFIEKILNRSIEIEKIKNDKFSIVAEKEEISKITENLIKEGYLIYEINKIGQSLEDAFVKRTGGHVID